MKRATEVIAKLADMEDISIHALVKRATDFFILAADCFSISIHALVKRATSVTASAISATKYFNPRPREEGDGDTLPRSKGDFISIHALVKRATRLYNSVMRKIDISIHALVKRATWCRLSSVY